MAAPSTSPKSRWEPRAARRAARATDPPELGLRVYTSRLLGAEPALVYAGGGNTSVKVGWDSLHGESVAALYVKASGADLATIDAAAFTPLELAPALRLLDLPALDDGAMRRELLRLRLEPDAPPPSLEALLHAFLPFRFVDHAHPEALLAWLQSPEGSRRAAEVYGEDCLIVPYVKPGFELARRCRRLYRAAIRDGRAPRGLVLENHGLFAFADDARESYETLLELSGRAARRLPRLPRRRPRPERPGRPGRPEPWPPADLARLRGAVSAVAGRPLAATLASSAELLGFLDRDDLGRVTQRGPLTPDHLIRTRRLPLVVARPAAIERTLARYGRAYEREFARYDRGRGLARLDLAPRVVLLPGTGVVGFGPNARAAALAAALYERTAWAIERAEALGGFRPLGPAASFEFEHWAPERAKLRDVGAPPLAGRVALVTGSASGIGRASARALLEQGAAVVGLDLVAGELAGDFVGLVGDATDRRPVAAAVALAARRFGGLDILVSNVGVFTAGTPIAELTDAAWRRSFAVNVDSHLALWREAVPLLRHAPAGGAVVVIGSKNVPAPGPGAAAYSASKAALTQLARVAALELARERIRVNVIHPDAVFDTGLWTAGVLAARAARYGLTVGQYRRRNLLAREVSAADVGALVAALAGDLFSKTTGAQIPVDGGNERVI